MNELYTDIKFIFERAGIDSFSKLPDNEAERGQFAKLFRLFNEHLEAARIQGFRWNKQQYQLKDADGKQIVISSLMDELTFSTLVQRYKELQSRTEGGGGSDDVPYDIDPYITEIDTGVIDAEYLNSRFDKYLKVLNGGTATDTERESVLEELHKSFASLSQEEQRFAGIFLHDVENGNVDLESGKTFKDYIIEYQTKAQNDSIHQVASDFGINEELLREMMNAHVTKDTINEYNRFVNLIATADVIKAKTFFERQQGQTLPTFKVKRMLDDYIRKYILEG